MSPVYQPPASGSGSVATDVIWDTKGDLAAATGADAAVKVAVGANGTVVIADSTQTAGIGWSVPIGTIVDYVESTTDLTVSATTEATAQTFVTGSGFTADGVSTYNIDFMCHAIQTGNSSGAAMIAVVYDGASAISTARIGMWATPSAAAMIGTGLCRSRVTPSAASHTYSIRFFRTAANGTVLASDGATGRPAFMMVTKAS